MGATKDICEQVNQLELAKMEEREFPPVHVWAKRGRVSDPDPKRQTDGGWCSTLQEEELQACYKHVPKGDEKLQPMPCLSPGARVMIIKNDVQLMALGLVNGWMGTLVGFLSKSPAPAYRTKTWPVASVSIRRRRHW